MEARRQPFPSIQHPSTNDPPTNTPVPHQIEEIQASPARDALTPRLEPKKGIQEESALPALAEIRLYGRDSFAPTVGGALTGAPTVTAGARLNGRVLIAPTVRGALTGVASVRSMGAFAVGCNHGRVYAKLIPSPLIPVDRLQMQTSEEASSLPHHHHRFREQNGPQRCDHCGLCFGRRQVPQRNWGC
jgi:hypothetical protein